MDSDDYWLPQKIEKQMHIFNIFSDVSLVSCDLYEVGKYGNYIKSSRRLFEKNIWSHLVDGWANFPNTSSLLFKKYIFIKLGGFDSSLTSCQDHDLWMRIGQNGIKVKYVFENLKLCIFFTIVF